MIHDPSRFVQFHPREHRRTLWPLLLGIPLAAGVLNGCQAPPQRYEREHRAMGTYFRILMFAPNEADADRAAQAAFARVDELERICSDYDASSELIRLCATAIPGEPSPISPDLGRILQEAQTLAVASGGAFDVTVGPVIRLWRRAGRRGVVPRPEQIDAARAAVGHSLLKLDETARHVTLAVPRMRIDLGGIAKGYAAQEALEVLRAHGVTRALVDAGGDLAIGEPPLSERKTSDSAAEEIGWRVGLPRADGRELPASSGVVLFAVGARPAVRLARCAVATSGDSGRSWHIDGRRYCHIIDPRTGEPLPSLEAPVTVVAPTASLADALASALSVLGPEAGFRLLEKYPGASARFANAISPEVSLGSPPDPAVSVEVVTSPGFPPLDDAEAP